jgi:4-amino-4-deoxy-L-arabinose transferase-like glycosyltransferase
MPSLPPRGAAASRRATLLLYGGACLLIVGVHLATNGVLGFHIDELYYLACGRHLALGYVDFPPLVPLIARLETSVLGVSPWALRFIPALLSGVAVLLSGAYARKLGGSLRLQAMALLIGVTAPLILGTWRFQTVIFDLVTWMVALYLFLSLVTDPRPRTWLLLGLTLGIGLEIKDTILALIAGIAIAVLVTPSLRRALSTIHPWLAALIAIVIWLPNLAWQVVNGFPTLSYVTNHQGSVQSGGGPVAFVGLFLLLLLLLTPLWGAGMIALFRQRDLRPIGIACAVPIAIFLFVGKFYYPAPTIPIVMAAGLLALSRTRRPRLRITLSWAVIVASILGCAVLLQITLPITPPDRFHATGLDSKVQDLANTIGWPEITQQMTAIYEGLSPKDRSTTVIVTSDYGVTGALDVYGAPGTLPASFSPQLTDYYWLPSDVTATSVLMVGYAPSDITWMCTSAVVVAHLIVPYQVTNIEQGAPVTYCDLAAPLPSLWPRLRNFS